MPDDWWRTAFDACYLERYAHRDAAEAEAAVAAIMPRLRGVRGPVLDAGCGAGRHLAVLRAAGVPAFGFDFSADLLTRAPASVRRGTVRADLRALPFAERSCGAVLLFFTVFGYFSEDENARVLSSLVRLCAPDGFVLLDLPDAERITLVPRTERPPGRWHADRGGAPPQRCAHREDDTVRGPRSDHGKRADLHARRPDGAGSRKPVRGRHRTLARPLVGAVAPGIARRSGRAPGRSGWRTEPGACSGIHGQTHADQGVRHCFVIGAVGGRAPG